MQLSGFSSPHLAGLRSVRPQRFGRDHSVGHIAVWMSKQQRKYYKRTSLMPGQADTSLLTCGRIFPLQPWKSPHTSRCDAAAWTRKSTVVSSQLSPGARPPRNAAPATTGSKCAERWHAPRTTEATPRIMETSARSPNTWLTCGSEAPRGIQKRVCPSGPTRCWASGIHASRCDPARAPLRGGTPGSRRSGFNGARAGTAPSPRSATWLEV